MANKLRKKRKQVSIGVLAVVVSNFMITAMPVQNIEVAKNIFLTFANIVMFIIVWDVYFEDKLSQKSPWGIVKDLLAITAVGTITTFIVNKLIIKASLKLISTWGIIGWIAGATIAGITTAIIGMIWAFYCDDLYRSSVV